MGMSDPKLKEAMSEITAILKKHDIAGVINLVSPTHSEFRYEIDPNWGCGYWEDKDKGLFRFKGNKDTHQKIELTAHMLFQLRDLSALYFKNMDTLCEQFQTQVKVEHTGFAEFKQHFEN